MTASTVNVLAICKGRELYVVLYHDGQECDACCAVGRWAADPQLAWTWRDAYRATTRIRVEAEKTKCLNHR